MVLYDDPQQKGDGLQLPGLVGQGAESEEQGEVTAKVTARPYRGPVETIIFVDVDGVVNIGAADNRGLPFLLNEDNLQIAAQLRAAGAKTKGDCVERLLVCSQSLIGHGEEGSFSKFACPDKTDLSDVLVSRLAQVIAAAGPRRLVVLASSWRKPKHKERVRKLESDLSRSLGRPFCFDAATDLVDERTAADRLETIGSFLQKSDQTNLKRVLLLEDFFITPCSGWFCGNRHVNCVEDAEDYIRSRARNAQSDLKVKLVHTYAEAVSASGVVVGIGAGLVGRYLRQALSFVDAEAQRTAEEARAAALEQLPAMLGARSSPISRLGDIKGAVGKFARAGVRAHGGQVPSSAGWTASEEPTKTVAKALKGNRKGPSTALSNVGFKAKGEQLKNALIGQSTASPVYKLRTATGMVPSTTARVAAH
eukprot:TRINITY_DN66371_c0_g1_i1.p1 TRINITY_DN66371_c0_g1~~TRINITY_DN66371_c0_g1_i1.p1  ORF type:complete len:443 (+),score=67.45 TRINITY_DN66371_c0_g1_i1:65-1330(+)